MKNILSIFLFFYSTCSIQAQNKLDVDSIIIHSIEWEIQTFAPLECVTIDEVFLPESDNYRYRDLFNKAIIKDINTISLINKEFENIKQTHPIDSSNFVNARMTLKYYHQDRIIKDVCFGIGAVHPRVRLDGSVYDLALDEGYRLKDLLCKIGTRYEDCKVKYIYISETQ